MIFNSIDFFIFLPIVFSLYWFVFKNNLKLQNLLIVISSYIFYGWWDWRFLSLILFSTLVDYFVGIGLKTENNESKRKLLLWISITVNLGLLGFFKYYNFFVNSFADAFTFFGSSLNVNTLNIILPVGISFYTFQTLSYSIDIYKKKLEPTSDFIGFAAFVCFFPQLVAGPIERATHLLPQFHTKRKFNYNFAVTGMRLIVWGLFKKVVIADRLSIFSNLVFNDVEAYNGVAVILAILFFTFQIYCDFSGYSDIAIGTARIFGFDLMTNFKMPYFSKSIKEFWSRWHISLSTWFRDYVYIPLGGNRVVKRRLIINLMATFLVSGFWHGANWTFIIWGGIHGLINILELQTENIRSNNFPNTLKILFTFSIVSFAWIFFRANSIADATYLIKSTLDISNNFGLINLLNLSFENKYSILIGVIMICFLIISEYVLLFKKVTLMQSSFNRRLSYIMLFLIFIFFGVFSNQSDFIYFQF